MSIYPRGDDPEPYDINDFEEYPKKSLCIKNNTGYRIVIKQLPSDWQHVNFELTSERIYNKEDRFPICLYNGESIVLTFNQQPMITR